MAVTAAYEYDIPAPNDAFFVNGEQAIGVAATLSGASGRTNYRLSKWFDFEGGEYRIRVVAVQSSLWSSAQGGQNQRSIFYTPKDALPVESTIWLPRGRQRLDILLNTLRTGAGVAYVAFSLFRQGKLVYASAADGWVYDTTEIADADVPALGDERLTYPVFAVLPNWADGITERFMYSTEAMSSEADVEQRRSLLSKPRRSFDVSFMRKGAARSRIDSLLAGVGANKILLPMWHEQWPLTETLTGEVTFPDGVLSLTEFTEGGLALVMVKDADVYEILEIDTIDGDTLTFVNPPEGEWDAGSLLFPLRVARMIESGAISNLTDAVGVSSIRFQVDDSEPSWYEPSWGFCAPWFRFQINHGDEIAVNYAQVTALIEQDAYGPVSVYDDLQKFRQVMRCSMQMKGRARVLAFRQFIDMARGRALRFWMPTFVSDLQPVGDLGGDTIDIRSIGFTEYFRTKQDFRVKIQIEFNSGRSAIVRDIVDCTRLDEKTEQIALANSLGAIEAWEIRRVSFLVPVRFDQDTFEIQHFVAEGYAARTAIVTRSLDAVDMPTLECAISSRIYPIDAVDGLELEVEMIALGSYVEPKEGIELTAAMTAFESVTIVFHETVMNDEALQLTAVMTAFENVPIVFHATTMEDEAIELTAAVTALESTRALIRKEIPDEAIELVAAMTVLEAH